VIDIGGDSYAVFKIETEKIKEKEGDSSRAGLTKLNDLEVRQPVVPPLSGAGGGRCSVKPA